MNKPNPAKTNQNEPKSIKRTKIKEKKIKEIYVIISFSRRYLSSPTPAGLGELDYKLNIIVACSKNRKVISRVAPRPCGGCHLNDRITSRIRKSYSSTKIFLDKPYQNTITINNIRKPYFPNQFLH